VGRQFGILRGGMTEGGSPKKGGGVVARPSLGAAHPKGTMTDGKKKGAHQRHAAEKESRDQKKTSYSRGKKKLLGGGKEGRQV